MSHVDEGRLAAYVDEPPSSRPAEDEIGSHLAGCAECRARVEAMRRERDKARTILRAGGIPAARPPSFADVLERSKTRVAQSTDRRKLSRLTSLAWAATVVLAVAVGWYARQASFRPAVAPAMPGAGLPISIDSPVIESRTPVPFTQPAARRAAERSRPAPAPAAAPATLPQDRADVARGQAANKLENAAPAPSAELRDAEKQLAGTTSGAGAAPLRKATSIAEWDDVSADAAALALGGKPLVLAEAPVTGYALSGSGDQVRIMQQMRDGTVIELVERRSGTEVPRPEPAAANRPRGAVAHEPRAAMPAMREADALSAQVIQTPDAASTIRDGYFVTLRVVVTPRGALKPDSLKALLMKLRP